MKSRCRLGLDSWADTGFPGKYAYAAKFVEDKIANVTGFISTLISIYKLPISYALYEFDKEDRTVVFIEHNNTIYMGDGIINSLANPIKCEDNDVRIDLITKV